ncbi:hypothetical protein [Lysobacter fragariae]
MSQNYGYRHVSAEKWALVTAKCEAFVAELQDGLSPITQDQKQRAVRMGDGSIAFVEQAVEVGARNIGMLPRNFDMDELLRDVQSRQRLHALRIELTRVLELVHNAEVAHGSDAMSGALDVYHHTKNSEGLGVEALRKMMGKRFERGPQEAPAGNVPAATA